jgi:hypothetical protein
LRKHRTFWMNGIVQPFDDKGHKRIEPILSEPIEIVDLFILFWIWIFSTLHSLSKFQFFHGLLIIR